MTGAEPQWLVCQCNTVACGTSYQPCPHHNNNTCAVPMPTYQWAGTTTLTWPPPPPRMSDDDVERIAKRVVELMKAEPK